MKKLTIVLCLIGFAVLSFFVKLAYEMTDRNSQLSAALGESKSVWIELRDVSHENGILPSTLEDKSGRLYQILRPRMDIQLSSEILALTLSPVTDQDHVVIYQSGKSEVRSAEELATQLLDEIKATN